MIIYINYQSVQTDDIIKIETNLLAKKYHTSYDCPLKNTELKEGEICNFKQWCGTKYYIINYIMKNGSIIEEKARTKEEIISMMSKILDLFDCDDKLDELNAKMDKIVAELDISQYDPSKLDLIKSILDDKLNELGDNHADKIDNIISALGIGRRDDYIEQIIKTLDDVNDKLNDVNTKIQEVQENNGQTMEILMNLPPSCGPNYLEASTHFHSNIN